MSQASVIVSTYDGANKIGRVLRALSTQSTQDFEVIVMVDGSTDATMEVIKQHRNKFQGDRLKVIWQENQGRGRVKNNGAQLASGFILIFFDDDTEPNTDAVKKHLQFHEQYTGVLAGNVVELTEAYKTDVANYKAYLTTRWTAKYSPGVSQLNEENLFFSAANCSMRQVTFFQLGGFDMRLRDAEDYDFALRALSKGVDVYFDKDNIVVHHENITCLSYIKRLREYHTAHGMFASFHPQRKQSVRESADWKRIIYYFFSFRFWPHLIDTGIFKFFLPRNLRYRLYDIVIQALSVEYAKARI